MLTPLAIDPAHPFPFIPNLGFSLALKLKRLQDGSTLYALVPVPTQVDRFWELPASGGARRPRARFFALEGFLVLFLDQLFPGCEVEGQGLFRLIRDSDVEIEEEAEDLVREFEARLKQRRLGSVVRVKMQASMPDELREFIPERLHAEPQDVVLIDGLLGLAELCQADPAGPAGPEVQAVRAALPRTHPRPWRRLLRRHPREGHPGPPPVRELRRGGPVPAPGRARPRTCWRSSRRSTAPRKDSPIVAALIEAAENGKNVTALVEIKARFDEEANLKWARDLERAGVHVVFGFVEYKTHAKLSVVVRREGDGLRTYCHFGTGNYHPVTAKIYTDLSLFTADPALARDSAKLFNYITGYADARAAGEAVAIRR